jgi:hypothetical protein
MNEFKFKMREKYGESISRSINSYFGSSIKVEKQRAGVEFIKRCLNNEKHPNFSRLNLANNELRHSKGFYNKIRTMVSEEELRYKNKLIKKFLAEIKVRQNEIDFTIEQHEMDILLKLTKEKLEKVRQQQKEIHNGKLANLGIFDQRDNKFVNLNRRGPEKIKPVELANPVFNLSSRTLSDIEERVLNKGLKYGIKAKRVDTFELLSRFEEFADSMSYLPIAESTDPLKANLNSKSTFFKELQSMADEFIKLSKQAQDNLSDEEREALLELAKDKTIVISKADKGNAVVIQDLVDYKRKVSDLLAKGDKFSRLNENVTRLRETRLQNQLRNLHAPTIHDIPEEKRDPKKEYRKHRLTDEVYNRILPCGSRAGVLYGLPKIHKTGTPLRPIISAVKTYNYELAKHLDEILKPLVNTDFMLKDTYDFVNKIRQIDVNKDRYLVSFDVESLFTNVPTLETIELILDLAFTDGTTIFNNLTRDELKKLLIVCTQESHFQFNGDYYDQIDGVSMGSPLGPLFANVFMSDFERKHMNRLKELGVNIWYRYVDDIFATLNNENQATAVLEYLNGQHKNIKFTIEHEERGKLPFLDTCVVRRVDKYSTNIYRKKTFTGVYLNWTSLTARRYKISLIRCLAERIWRICSEEKERLGEIEKLKVILQRNDYPLEVIERTLGKFIENKAKPAIAIEAVIDERPTKRFFKLPYVSGKCEDFAHRMKLLVDKSFPTVEFNVAFQAPMTIGKLFPFKDNIKKADERSMVVYSLKCSCGVEYVGKTERILLHRLNEHVKNSTSSCKKHVDANKHKDPKCFIDISQVEIVDCADTGKKLKYKELLHILTRKPELNKQLGPQSKFEKKTHIIKAYPQFNTGQ